MDARTSIERRLPSRQVTASSARATAVEFDIQPRDIASRRSADAALHLPMIAHQYAITLNVTEIFKKTPCAADLKPRGRYVAKDMYEVGSIPLLKKTLLDNGHLHGDCLTVPGRTIAENLKSVKRVEPITVTGGVVGLLRDGDSIEFDEALNVKLTDAELAERKTKWKARATNHRSGALWKYAQQAGPAVDGAVTGGAHEKQCYAGI